jgi:hypothetical protein
MLHLPTDRLAALGDEPPTSDEEAHLAACADCARERDAYRTLVAMAHAERDSLGLPLTRWDAIAAELALAPSAPELARSTTDAGSGVRSVTPAGRTRWPMQIAAGLLLVAGGMMAGRASAGAGPLPQRSSASIAAAASAASATNASLSSDSTLFLSVEDARAAQLRSEVLYQQAAAFLAQHDTTGTGDGNPVAYRSRLAALDRVISTTREAMRDAPHDPVINGYYLTTLGQREATLRQLNTALPASLRLNSF